MSAATLLSPDEVALPPRPGLALRLRARVHRGALDHRLADGEDPVSSRELALRAGQLTCPDSRRKLASSIERLVADAEAAPRLSAAVSPPRVAVLAARGNLLGLAEDLRGQPLVRPQGVAEVRRLLIDGGSDLYTPGDVEALEHAVEHARRGLFDPSGGGQ
jgi:hypothetical protein